MPPTLAGPLFGNQGGNGGGGGGGGSGAIVVTGLVSDYSLATGENVHNINIPATDNHAAIMAAYNQGQALGRPFQLIFPPNDSLTAYYVASDLVFNGTYPCQLTGALGDSQGAQFEASRLAFPVSENPVNGDVIAKACLTIDAGGWGANNLTFWRVGAAVKWTPNAVYDLSRVVPSFGTFGYMAVSERVPHQMGPSASDEIFLNACPGGIVDFDIETRYELNQLLYVCGIIDSLNPGLTPWRYIVTAVTGDQQTTANYGADVPFTGAAEPWQPNTVYAPGAVVRPTNAGWTPHGSYFATSGGLTSGALEPNWSAHDNNGDIVPDGTGTWNNNGKCWPRSTGLPVVSNNVTFELDDTSGLLHDPNTNGTNGPFDWTIKPPIPYIQANASGTTEDCLFAFPDDGVHWHGETSSPGDGWRAIHCAFINTANKCVEVIGGDANVGVCRECIFSQYGNAATDDQSFLGCSFYDNNYTTGGTYGRRYSARRVVLNGQSKFSGNYTEGGSAPHWIREPSTFESAKGSPSFKFGVPLTQTWGSAPTPFSVFAGPLGHQWAVGLKVVAGSHVYPDPANGKNYVVDSTPANAVITLTLPQPAFTGHTATNDTFIDGQGVHWRCTGTSTSQTFYGNDTNPAVNISVLWSDHSVSFDIFQNNCPFDDFVGVTANTQNNQCTLAQDQTTLHWWLGLVPISVGFTFPQKSWWWDQAIPVSGTWAAGSRVWNDGTIVSQSETDYWYTAAGGSPGTWTEVPTTLAASQHATGGVDPGDSTPLPDDFYLRWAHTVTSATAVTINSYTPPDGSVVDIAWDFVVKQTAGAGNPKGGKFRATVSVRRAGAALTVEDAAVVVPGSSNEIAVTVIVDLTAPPAINLTLNSADATKTFVCGGDRQVIGVPTS